MRQRETPSVSLLVLVAAGKERGETTHERLVLLLVVGRLLRLVVGAAASVIGALHAVNHVDKLHLAHVGVAGIDKGVQLVAAAKLLVDGVLQLVQDLLVHAIDGLLQLVEAVREGVAAVGCLGGAVSKLVQPAVKGVRAGCERLGTRVELG